MISQELLLSLTVGGIVLSAFAATAAQILHEFARHELEEFCRKRQKPIVFEKIIENREQLALGAEALQIISLSIAHVCGLFWLWSNSMLELEWLRLAGVIGVCALIGLATNSWLPWALARIADAPFLFFTWRFWWIVARVTQPLSVGFALLSALLYRAAGQSPGNDDEEGAFDDEIRSMVSEGERDGLLDYDAREMIEGVIELDDTDVAEIMTPKKSIIAMDVETPWDQVIDFIIQHHKTRVPVYEGELNRIVGFVHSKDLLPEIVKPPEQRKSFRELLREPMFVPESMLVDELLQQFQADRRHMAIVQDEYGGVAGLITIEDIIEEIVGDIVDETEPDPEPTFRRIDRDTILMDGSTRIEKLNDELGWDLPEDLEVDTVAGLMMYHLKDIPRHQQLVQIDDFELRAIGRHPRVVEQVLIKRSTT